MKWLWPLLASMFLVIGASQAPLPVEPAIVIVGGDIGGYLTPCGCTKPMSGGILRRISLTRQLTRGNRSLVLENGGWLETIGRQQEMKAETMAQAMGSVKAVVHLRPSELRLGRGMADSIGRLAGHRALVAGVSEAVALRHVISEDFAIGVATPQPEIAAGIYGGTAMSLSEQLRELVQIAEQAGKPAILMIDGSVTDAEEAARLEPSLRLIVYSSKGDPPPTRVIGRTTIVSPGELGKHLLRLEYSDGAWTRVTSFDLGPDVSDDPEISRFYLAYQDRIRRANLIEQLPRVPSAPFSGSKSCASCHTRTYEIWKKSKHAIAYNTLEKEGVERDPECVGCHVVGLNAIGGFLSRSKTPRLAEVGCESCHGPSRDHARNPWKVRTSVKAREACVGCHTPTTSPNFAYDSFWESIKHK